MCGPLLNESIYTLHTRMLFGWNWPTDSGEDNFKILSMYFHHFVIISPFKRAGPFIWTKLNPLHPGMICAKFGWNRPSGSGEEFFFIFVNVVSLFHNYLPLEKARALHLNKLESFNICAKFGWNRPSGSAEDDLLSSSMYFRYFCSWKRAGPFIWPNLNPVYPRMLCAKIGWNWLSGSGEEDF